MHRRRPGRRHADRGGVGAAWERSWDFLAPRNSELGPRRGHVQAGTWRHWQLRTDDNGIGGSSSTSGRQRQHAVDEEVLIELNDVLEAHRTRPAQGVVLRSGKAGGFIAGADIGQFRGMTDPAAVGRRLREAHAIIDRLDHSVPTVAVIHGYCLGGGLELALACDYRIAIEDARLGFPEVMLGLHPGLGGTVRLPRLINPLEAMTMMLTGRNVRAAAARSRRPGGRGDAGAARAAAVKAAVAGKLRTRRGGLLGHARSTRRRRASSPPGACARETAKKAPSRTIRRRMR